jgi:hypothetical protein
MNEGIVKTIPLLTEPFVQMGIYKTQGEALKQLVLQHIKLQIEEAQREIAHFQRKYGTNFGKWTKSLVGRATVEEEDDWMRWESARDMLESWERVKAEIERCNV